MGSKSQIIHSNRKLNYIFRGSSMKKAKPSAKQTKVYQTSDASTTNTNPEPLPLSDIALYPRPKNITYQSPLLDLQEDYYNHPRIRNTRKYNRKIVCGCFKQDHLVRIPRTLRLMRSSRYVRSIDIHYIYDYPKMKSLFRLPCLSRVHIYLHPPINQNYKTKRNKLELNALLQSLPAHLKSIYIKSMYSCYSFEAKDFFTMVSNLAHGLRAFPNLENLCFEDLDRGLPDFIEKSTLVESKLVQKARRQLSRLTRLKGLTLCDMMSRHSRFSSIFLENPCPFKGIERLELRSSTNQTRKLIDNVKGMSSLSSIIFHDSIDPEDLFLIIASASSLRKVSIREVWLFNRRKMPALSTLNPETVLVSSVHIEPPLLLCDENGMNFIASFLSPFRKLTCLKLYIESDANNPEHFSPLNAAVKDCPLEELVLCLSQNSGKQVRDSLGQLTGLTRLKKLSFVAKLLKAKQWKTGLKFICPAVLQLIRQNPGLRSFEFYIERVSSNFLEQVKELFGTLTGLNNITFAYSKLYVSHRKSVENVLNELEDIITGYNASEKLTLYLECPPQLHYSNEEWEKYLTNYVKKGSALKEFNFEIKDEIDLPFCKQVL